MTGPPIHLNLTFTGIEKLGSRPQELAARTDHRFESSWKRPEQEKYLMASSPRLAVSELNVPESLDPSIESSPQPFSIIHSLLPSPVSSRPNRSLYESLSKDYSKWEKPRNYFRTGRVFAMLWHENIGTNGTEMTNQIELSPRRGKYNESVYGSIRRMVVIRPMEGACWCCPITTYSGRGVAKPGLTPEGIRHHAIIYMAGTQPARKASEVGMTKNPISVDPSQPREKLDQMSRLNFGKIYTVEHNVKVKSVGTITKESMPAFEAYVVDMLTEK